MRRVSSFVTTISIKTLGDNLMKKALLPLLIASALPTVAFADVTVYGKAWLSFQNSDINNYTPGVSNSYTEVRNNESRLGVKGSESIDDDLKAIYQYEVKIGADSGNAASGSTIGNGPFAQRNIYVGLQGTSWGTVKAGMFDTPLKLAQEKTDVFKDMIGDWKNVFQGETRAANILQYSTPAFSNITGNIAYVSSEQAYENTSKDGYSASIVYDTKTVYVALANDHNVSAANANTALTAATAALLTKERLDVDIVRLVGRFTIGPVVLGALYETYDNNVKNAKGDETKDGVMVSAIYNIDPTWALKAQYGASDMITLGGETESVGVDYKLSKNTKLTGYYTVFKDDGYNATTKVNDSKLAHDDKWLGVALELNF